jgi:hypothetical protein
MDKGDQMKKCIAILLFTFTVSNAYSKTNCEDIVSEVGANKSGWSLFGALFGNDDSTVAAQVDCETVNLVAAMIEDAVSDSERKKVAESQRQIDESLAVYKAEMRKVLGRLEQVNIVHDEALLQLKDVVKELEVNDDQKLLNLGKLQEENKILIAANEKNINLRYEGLEGLHEELSNRIAVLSTNLETAEGNWVKKLDNNNLVVNQNVAILDQKVRDELIYLIAAITAILIISGLLFYLLRKKMASQSEDLTKGLLETRTSLEEEFVKIDSKLVEIFESKMQLADVSAEAGNAQVDHSLVIKVADEIVRIQKNISRMDEKTKGLKQLSASVTRIQDNVVANGYEIVVMLGMPYSEGMKVSATFVPDEDLEEGVQVITRIIKPQINYQGVMVQSAQIEVSQGE